jgi:hypothetical protein
MSRIKGTIANKVKKAIEAFSAIKLCLIQPSSTSLNVKYFAPLLSLNKFKIF